MDNLLKIENPRVIKLIEYIKEKIKGTHYEGHVFMVGGSVRDAIMGIPSNDIDIAVDIPNGGVGFANYIVFTNGSLIPTKNPVIFPKYGTAKFNFLNSEFKDINVECVQTQKIQYPTNQDKKVTFGTIDEDATHRDLTINALYYDISNDKILDPTKKGLDDIEKGILRTTNDPSIIFNDDPLRILRIIRFASLYQWGIEKETWLGMIEYSRQILFTAQERITAEINKILLSPIPSVGLRKMAACGSLLEWTLPAVFYMKHIYQCIYPQITLFDHTMDVVDAVPSRLETRLAALYHDLGKLATFKKNFLFHADKGAELAERLMKSMKYSTAMINNVSKVVRMHEVFSKYRDKETPSKAFLRDFRDKAGDLYDDILDVIDANNKFQVYGRKPRQVASIRARVEKMEAKERKNYSHIVLPINGNDIMKKFHLKGGPTIGRLLRKIKKAYTKNPHITKDECFKLLEPSIEKKKK